MSAAMERINIDMEEAARTLGAKPFTVFRTIVWPITKYSILSGAIIVFTRSVSETGATSSCCFKIADSTCLDSKLGQLQFEASISPIAGVNELTVGLACGLLILFSFIILLVLRLLTRKGKV